MKCRASLALLLLAATGRGAFADLRVQVERAPESVLLYSPVLVVLSVKNIGSEPVVFAASETAWNGPVVEFSSDGERFQQGARESGCFAGGDAILRLAPGEKRFFIAEAGFFFEREGTYWIRASLRGNGGCRVRADLGARLGLRQTGDADSLGIAAYECWGGEAISEPVALSVREPSAMVDREALALARNRKVPPGVTFRLAFAYEELRSRFPASAYVPIAAAWRAYTSDGNVAATLAQVAALQPDNPVREELETYSVRSLLYASVRCMPRPENRPARPKLNELRVAPPLRAYLKQLQTELDAHDCPPIRKLESEDRAQDPLDR